MGKGQLGYWNIRGLAQSIRYALAYMEVDFDEVVYPDKEGDDSWTKAKPTLGLCCPNLPYWIDDKEKMTESKAILKYLIRTHMPSLLPTNISMLVKSEEIEGIFGDIDRMFAMSVYTDTDAANGWFESTTPPKVEALSKYLGDKKFFLGNELSFVDFLAYETLYRLKTYKPKFLEGHQNLIKYVESVENVPAIAKFIQSPGHIKAPCYSRYAIQKI